MQLTNSRGAEAMVTFGWPKNSVHQPQNFFFFFVPSCGDAELGGLASETAHVAVQPDAFQWGIYILSKSEVSNWLSRKLATDSTLQRQPPSSTNHQPRSLLLHKPDLVGWELRPSAVAAGHQQPARQQPHNNNNSHPLRFSSPQTNKNNFSYFSFDRVFPRVQNRINLFRSKKFGVRTTRSILN